MTTDLTCRREQRRAIARMAGSNGIAGITVSEDQTRISVELFGKAPDGLTTAHLRVEPEAGGRPVTVVRVQPCPDPDPEDSECLLVTVGAPGDRGCYTLSIVATDARGRPGTTPYPGFDRRFAALAFSFAEHCPQTGDCGCGCGGDARASGDAGPVIDYLARDYPSLRQLLLDRLTLTMPHWTERHEADVGMTMVELLSYAGDLLHYRLDAVSTEAYLETARLRTSVRRHARLVDYRMHDGVASRAFVCLDADDDVTLPAGRVRFRAGAEVFEPLVAEDLRIVKANRRISLWTWGDAECCLPAGASEAVLVAGEGVLLEAGDLVVFEEVVGAVTGLPADADHTHRQVVRLLEVVADRDELLEKDLLRVRWAHDDALRFDLCVSSRGGPDCVDLEVGVVRANVVVVGHGATQTWCQAPPEVLDWPPAEPHERGCADPTCFGCVVVEAVDRPAYPPRRPTRRVRLSHRPVTREAPWPDPAAVARAQAAALGQLVVTTHERLLALLEKEDLADDDVAWLTTVFGSATLHRYDVPSAPEHGVPALLAGFDRLLGVKLERLERLRCRARSGTVLRQDVEGRELAWSWGVADLVDPGRAALRGPAASVNDVDPRRALPTVAVVSDDDLHWVPSCDLLAAGPEDVLLVGEVDDDGYTWLRFGDGRQGRRPAPGARLVAAYKVGNGTRGNVGAEAIDSVELCGVDAGVIRVRNPLPACGGRDPEPIAEARVRAPRQAFTDLQRAITADDYARLAEQVPGVQRAGAALRWTGAWFEAQVALDALGTDVPSAELLVAERERLHRVRRLGHDVVVGPARQVSLALALCVRVAPGYVAGHVREAITELLGARPGPGRIALFAPDRLTFGTPVRLSAVVAAVQQVPGVAEVTVTGLTRQFGPDDDGRAVADGVLELAELEVARLDNDAARPDHGLVALVIGGGR